MLSVFVDTTSGQMQGTFTEYDSSGRAILKASPSAVKLPASLATLELEQIIMDSIKANRILVELLESQGHRVPSSLFPARRVWIGWILAISVPLLAVGCTPLSYGKFINISDEKLRITLLTAEDSVPPKIYRLEMDPNATVSAEIQPTTKMLVRDVHDSQLFEDAQFSHPAGECFYDPETHSRYFLITRNEVLSVPIKWWGDWKQHIVEIRGSQPKFAE